MFRIVKRLIHWTGKYRKRILYWVCLRFFFTAFFTAIPIMLAAKGLSAVFRRFFMERPFYRRRIYGFCLVLWYWPC